MELEGRSQINSCVVIVVTIMEQTATDKRVACLSDFQDEANVVRFYF